MPQESGGICGRLTSDLALGCLQGGWQRAGLDDGPEFDPRPLNSASIRQSRPDFGLGVAVSCELVADNSEKCFVIPCRWRRRPASDSATPPSAAPIRPLMTRHNSKTPKLRQKWPKLEPLSMISHGGYNEKRCGIPCWWRRRPASDSATRPSAAPVLDSGFTGAPRPYEAVPP